MDGYCIAFLNVIIDEIIECLALFVVNGIGFSHIGFLLVFEAS